MSLISDGLIYTSLNILNRVIPFLLLPIILNYTSTEDFGLYSYFILIETILIPIVSLNLSAAYTTHYFSKSFSDLEYLSTVLFSILICSILFLIVYFLFSPLFITFVDLSFEFVCLAIASASFNSVISTCLNLFRLEKRPWMYGILSILQSFVMFSLVYLFVKYSGGYKSIVFARFYGYLFIFAFVILFLFYKKAVVFKFNYYIFKSIFKFGIPTVFYSLSAFVFLNSDRFFIKHFLGVDYLGFYSAIVQICAVMSVINSSLSAAWMPWLFENLNKKIVAIDVLIVKVSYSLIFLVFIFGTLLFFSLPRVVGLLFPKPYNDFLYLSFPIILGFIFEAIYLIISPYVYYVGKTKYNAYVGILIACINVFLNLILVPYFGLTGAAISTMFSWIILTLSFVIFSSKSYPMPWFYFKNSYYGKRL